MNEELLMSKHKIDWEDVFSRYKASSLSQSAFCKQNNLSNNQFQYRWYERNKALKAHASPEQFESISVISTPAVPMMISTINMSIHLPNEIRCDVTTDLNGLSPILAQLVQLC
jgi:hypothetical protein